MLFNFFLRAFYLLFNRLDILILLRVIFCKPFKLLVNNFYTIFKLLHSFLEVLLQTCMLAHSTVWAQLIVDTFIKFQFLMEMLYNLFCFIS
jgi:hypothetical protein